MISSYFQKLQSELQTGNAREHSYRPALKDLFEEIDVNVKAVNEPSRSAHGAPDFIFKSLVNTNLIRGYAEAKDVDVNLDAVEKKEQLDRYRGYSNLILTNYIEFRFFRNGQKYQTIVIGRKNGNYLESQPEQFELLNQELKAFLSAPPENITNASRLAEIMGGKAARIRMNVSNYLKIEDERNEELLKIFKVMQELLVHDLEPDQFADMYAQTLVYGLFVARYYDETSGSFSRQEARDLVPASNPFLRHFFDHIVGPNFDKRLSYIVDELCEVFTVSDVSEIVLRHYNLFGEVEDQDPIIHFYEDFLKQYDPQLRKDMGAYYTPVAVVQFIVKAVDEVLKIEFGLAKGLADTEKVERKVMTQGTKGKEVLHRVQILDPAVGTATFLNEAIKFIYKSFKGQEGLWKSYVQKELLPRMHGFEFMMAPYTIAHLKLAMTLKESGIDHFEKRLGVYLTNSLEEGMRVPDDLFKYVGITQAISEESQAATKIKQETPIMVVMGNPPYKGESFNKGEYAMSLVEKYKCEPGGKEKLKERNSKWINDDYVKFIAFAEEMVSKTGEGIVAMITNHGYLDNPTFRGMRWRLLETFSKIYVLDLHGNAKKKDISPDGSVDQNVFEIMQGVAIIVAVKHKDMRKGLAEVYRGDVWGKRGKKFEYLQGNSLESVKWENVRLSPTGYIFANKNEKIEKEYLEGIKVNELFPVNSVGIVTARDDMSVQDTPEQVTKVVNDFVNLDVETLRAKYDLRADVRDWTVSGAKDDVLKNTGSKGQVTKILYRPFDIRYTFYTGNSRGFHCYPRSEVMQHFLTGENVGLITVKRVPSNQNAPFVFVSSSIVVNGTIRSDSTSIDSSFPLYLYPDGKQRDLLSDGKRKANLDMELVRKLLGNIGEYEWVDDEATKVSGEKRRVSPLDVFDYVYAALHSLDYRVKYQDFLKSDFPRVPIAKDRKSFWKLVELGGLLRRLHLMESMQELVTMYPVTGENLVEKVEYKGGNVWINERQYFGGIPSSAWELFVGGYQPAQKWLKDRKGKKLEYEQIMHYQQVVAVLVKTEEVMREIDEVMG